MLLKLEFVPPRIKYIRNITKYILSIILNALKIENSLLPLPEVNVNHRVIIANRNSRSSIANEVVAGARVNQHTFMSLVGNDIIFIQSRLNIFCIASI